MEPGMKITISIWLLITTLSICESIAQEPVDLIEQRKYESAFKLLKDRDPDNLNPEIVIQKVDLAINYFVTSIMHHKFAFKDLSPGEDLSGIRGTNSKYHTYSLPVDSILTKLIDRYPENMNLRKMLGIYYYDVHYRYGSQWYIPEDSLINLFREHLIIAYQNGIYDDKTLYMIGYANLLNGDYMEAINFFKLSLELNEDAADCHYSLAHTFMVINEWQEALYHAHKSMTLFDNNCRQGDAARMVAFAFEELGNLPKALDFYRTSNRYCPNQYATIKPMLSVTSRIGNKDDLTMHAKDLLDLDPDNPRIFQDLLEIFYNIDAQLELVQFLNHQLIPYDDNTLVKAYLHFYQGVIHYDLRDKYNARACFEAARSLFNQVYREGHEIFPTIQSYLNSL